MRFRTTDRDVGLRRVSSLTRWLAGGAVALMGVLSAMVAQALPGASGTSASPQPPATAGTPSAPSVATHPSPPTPADPSLSDPNLQPAPPPVVTHHQSVARSGGS
jgi:hypothetical protein